NSMIKTRLIVEIAGFPKEHIEETMKRVMEKIKAEKKVLKYNIYEAEQKDKLFSTFAEVEIEFPNLDELSGFCFDYMPSSIEILSEEKLNMVPKEYENILNDILAKLHHYDMIIKNLKAENMNLKKQN
ncbi:MAG: hypothetical protein KJ674_03550, partial [Nanoarchaeota archaeon]|nr:hypothetical protein [Nanoarchaeota archaeon]